MDYNLCDIKTVERLLKENGFKFSKSLGQNFIIDDTVCPEMAEQLGSDSDTLVIEIGAGVGVLTKELCRVSGKVVSIELDRRLYPVLEETLSDYDNFELVEGDVLKLDLRALISEKRGECKKIKVCANLPYYITSPVIMRLLEEELGISEIEVMVQKEAGERLCAKLGERESGAISAAVQYRGEATRLFDVGRECFMPSPKVDSEVIKITLYEEPVYKIESEKDFFNLVRAAFSQRRKTLVNSVSSTLGIPKKHLETALFELGLDSSVRAERLTMEDFVRLYVFL